jgi:hypothetical protein
MTPSPSSQASWRAISRKRCAAMPSLTFRANFIRFIERSHAVHIVGDHGGKSISILIGRRVIEYLAEAADLDRDQSFTTVVRNKECLECAVERAADRYGDNFYAIAIELPDVKLTGIKARPMVVRRESDAKATPQA